jgi:hypothetical protein
MWRALAERLQSFHETSKPNNKWWGIGSWSATTPFQFNYNAYNASNYDSMWQMNIDLHDAMGEYWEQIKHDPEKVFKYALWIVEEWGAIHSNLPSTIQSYCDRILRFEKLEKHDGVASYSKILSAVNRRRYFILDARVAASLNILQLDFMDGTRQYFHVTTGQNKAIKKFNAIFPFAEFKKIGYRRYNKKVYSMYNDVIFLMAKHLGLSGIEVEMMLFSNADLLLPSNKAADALFTENTEDRKRKRHAQFQETEQRLKALGFIS